MSDVAAGGRGGLVLDNVLMSPSAPVSAEAAEQIAADRFGITGRASALTGERDANFLLVAESGEQIVLKVSHPNEAVEESDLQTQVLVHLSGRGLPVPSAVLPVDGGRVPRWRSPTGEDRNLRVVSFLEGQPAHQVAVDDTYCVSLGRLAARIDQALADFSHPHAARSLSWDARRLGEVCPPDLRAGSIAPAIVALEEALPRLAALPDQLIHNDLNPHNLIANTDENGSVVSGVIDFGDVLRAPRVLEIATAAAYHVVDVADPWRSTSWITQGYHAVNPLGVEEIRLIPVLVLARVALSLTINRWMASKDPERASYLLRNTSRTATALEALAATDLGRAGDDLAAAVLNPHEGEA